MSANSKNEDTFDEMLATALRRHAEVVPADFTETMLEQVREAEAKRILLQVVFQERLALAMSVALGAVAIIGAVFFPRRIVVIFRSIGASLAGYGGRVVGQVPQAIEVVGGEWQFYAVLAVVLAFAVYCLMDLLFGDRLRML